MRRKMIHPIFHLQSEREDDEQLTKGMINVVRKTGQLNLSGRALATVPKGVFSMYDIGKDAVANFDMSKDTEENWWSFKPLTYLDCSSNVLTDIPTDIKLFEDLTVLNLQDNNLSTLPESIGALKKLTKMNLSRNKIASLPREFYSLGELQHLNIAHNCLEKLGDEFVDMVMLQTLDLSNNLLTSLPTGIGYLVRVTEFNVSHNQLTELPLDISCMRAMTKLDVTHNNLKSLPNMSDMRKLHVIHAQHNDIEDLPMFEGCDALQELHFGNNFIKAVTEEFCENLPLLKILDLRDNKIEELPDKIAMLQHLIRLDLTNNELTALPNSLGLLSHLQNLQIEGNKFRHIRQDLLKAGTCRLLKHLRDKMDADESIRLSPSQTHTSLSPEPRIFPDKYMMRNSRAVNLAMKEISFVPDEVFKDALSADVHIVDISKNKLLEVPSGLQIVADNVSELNLNTNKLKTLPSFIADFTRLQYLDVGRNQLSDLPDLKGLPNMRELILSFNAFTSVPECVYSLEKLEILLISDNQVRKIDVDGLKRLQRLATLDFTNNSIDHVPFELGLLKQIRCVELKGNSFRQPRYAILEQGTDSVMAYLRDRIPQ